MTAKSSENPIGTNAHSRARFPFVLGYGTTWVEYIITIKTICEVTGEKHPDLKIKARFQLEAEKMAELKKCDKCHELLV